MSRVLLDLRRAARAHRLDVPALPHLAASARATWLGRMVNEHGSAHVFEALADQLADAGFAHADVVRCRGFAAEERRHGVLCGAVVESLGGEAQTIVDRPVPVPCHDDVGREEAVLRNLLSVSCLSETVAVALIAAEREEMPEGPLRALLTGIWSDEVGHARFGWAIVRARVPGLSAAARARLGVYLGVALRHLEEHELAHLPLSAPPPHGSVLGLCNGAEARVLFYETIEQVILPGLEALGLPARKAWRERRELAAAA